MRLLELFEAESKHITFCFGRMNPPTIGHAQVFKTMASQGGDFQIFVSQSQDRKENPLSYDEKINFIKAIHPQYADKVIENRELNTVVKVASYLYEQGYRNATFVAGSDRLDSFKKLLSQYNGVEGKAHGYYKFDVLDFVSAGERDPDSEGVSGVSASKARAAAANNDFEAFKEATGAGEVAKEMFAAVRKGMGITESFVAELKIRPGQTYDEKYKGWNLRYQIRPAEGSKEFKGRADHMQSKQTKPIGPLSASSKEELVQKLKDAIDDSRGSNQIPSGGTVTIFFNSTLARDVIGHGGEIYADIVTDGGKPVLLLSSENQGGMYRATDRSPRHQREKEGHVGQQAFVMPAKEAIKNGLTLARYALGKAEIDYMPGITAIPLEFRNEVYPGEVVRMDEPGLTVSPPRKGQTIGEAPIEMDPADPMDPMIYGTGANPGKLKYRMMRAAGQFKDLAARVDKASPSEWQTMIRQFDELKMNVEQIKHGLEELAKVRKKGGVRSRGIDSRIESVEEGQFRSRDIEDHLISNKKLNDLKSKYLPDWEMLDHKTLQAKYVAKDHRHAEEFVSFINKVSEQMDHFAEVTQDVAEVTVKTTTFDVKGLTVLDFKLALKVDKYAEANDIEQVRMQGNFGMHESNYGRYWCSTDKKWKTRKGPKQKRAS